MKAPLIDENTEKLILNDLAGGELVTTLQKKYGVMPWSWMRHFSNPVHSEVYLRAREMQADALADDVVRIADEEEDAHRARVRTDARKWYASKLRPSIYGERIDVTIDQRVSIRAALEQAEKRVALPTGSLVNVIDAQVIDSVDQSNLPAPDKQSVDDMLS